MDARSDHANLSPGDRLGHYRIERPLGAGGMGAVFAARDELLERPVALKLLRSGSDEALVDEARALAAFNHPNIVRIYGLDRIGDRSFVVMERIEGRSLDEVLEADGRLAPAAVVDIVGAVAEALTAIHAAGRIHGDVKPSNILLEERTGRVLVTDFGLSQPIDGCEGPLAVRGTPEYLAPERARGLRVPRELRTGQDVYSLAAAAFDLLTGRPPFDERDVQAVLRKQAFDDPPRPTAVWPALSWRIDRALLAALKKSPGERTATPAELAHDLSDAVARGRTAPRILLADDDGDHRQVVSLGLAKRLGHVLIECASDGHRALRAAVERAPDLAIVDLDMPGLNGLELAMTLRSLPGGARLPIVVVSGRLGSNEREVLERVGIDRWFDKPVLLWRLAGAVRELLGLGVERASGQHRRVDAPRTTVPALDEAG